MTFLFRHVAKSSFLNLCYLEKNRRLLQTSALLLRKSYYDVLGVNINATDKEIKRAYFKKSKKYHPDANVDGSEESKKANQKMFLKVQKAYEVLGNLDLKDEYDKKVFGRVSSHERRTPKKDIYETQSSFYTTVKRKPEKRSREERHQLVERSLVSTSFSHKRETHEYYEELNRSIKEGHRNNHLAPLTIVGLIVLIVIFVML